MPSRDPKTGKPLSGWQKEKRARARAQGAASGERSPVPESFKALGPPPIADTGDLITWGARAAALALYETMLDEDLPAQERRRFVLDGAAKLGLIQDKLALRRDVQRAIKSMKGEDKVEGLTPIPPSARHAPILRRNADDTFTSIPCTDPRHPKYERPKD